MPINARQAAIGGTLDGAEVGVEPAGVEPTETALAV
jgi:hypothetical protein